MLQVINMNVPCEIVRPNILLIRVGNLGCACWFGSNPTRLSLTWHDTTRLIKRVNPPTWTRHEPVYINVLCHDTWTRSDYDLNINLFYFFNFLIAKFLLLLLKKKKRKKKVSTRDLVGWPDTIRLQTCQPTTQWVDTTQHNYKRVNPFMTRTQLSPTLTRISRVTG